MKVQSGTKSIYNKLAGFAGTGAIMLAAVSAVLTVQAYLTAATDPLENPFTPMDITYTNTDIVEDGGTEITGGRKFTFSSAANATTPVTVNKSAQITNPAGRDRKPVFVRAAVTLSVIDPTGTNPVDVTTDYPCKLDWNSMLLGTNWVKGTDGYCYYTKILNPSDSVKTTDIFNGGGVKFLQLETVPENYQVVVNVIADTVQAVAIDDTDWGAKDYTTAEMTKAWGLTPTLKKDGSALDTSALSAEEKASQNLDVDVDWSFGS